MPRFNAWIVAAAVLVALTWWSPEQFEPDQIRRSVKEGSAHIRRSVSRIAQRLGNGLIVLDPAAGKPAKPQGVGEPDATKD